MSRYEFAGDWGVDALADALDADRTGALPTYGDERAWARVRTADVTAGVVDRLLERAERIRTTAGLAVPTASEYLRYGREGDLDTYHTSYGRQRIALTALAVAECVEREGQYLDPVLDYAWSICERTSWLLPAHRSGSVPGLPTEPVPDATIDLDAALTALLLANLDRLFGDRLPASLRERVRAEVERRVLVPYEREDHWWADATNNWNAVCTAGCVGAAIRLVDDSDRLARLLGAAADGLERYLRGFDEAGCTHEGIGYWNYGFGYFVLLSELVGTATGGRRSLASAPIVAEIAGYPRAVELSPGRFLPFGDASETDGLLPYAACWAGTEFDVPSLVARGRYELATERPVRQLPRTLRNLFWCLEADGDAGAGRVHAPPERVYFPGDEWWLARVDAADPDGLVVAAKGGHNGESHNHLDCGSFVVHHRGESPLTDLGKPRYDRDYFSEDRYDYLVARSLGHSVPLVDGHEQGAGEAFAASVRDRHAGPDAERIAFDLGDCYPEAAGVASLRRRIGLDRTTATVTVRDTVRFDPDAGEARDRQFTSVLVSYAPMSVEGDALVVEGERTALRVDPTPAATIDVEHLPTSVTRDEHRMRGDWHEADPDPSDVWRARLQPRDPAPEADAVDRRLGLEIAPAAARERFGRGWRTDR